MGTLAMIRRLLPGALLSCAAAVILVAGCARESNDPLSALSSAPGALDATVQRIPDQSVVRQDGSTPPALLVTASFGGASLRLWPFTGSSFDGAGVDPVNLFFVGRATPAQIRDALLGLDGNRVPLGFPAAPPFDQRWKDGFGDVQTGYAEPTGWSGSEIQLTLGEYDPARFHLRLFRTASPFGDGGWWTVGAAHFELLIPGTTDHQVVSWERAEEIVVADLMRSGLLDRDVPMGSAEGVGPTPSWREIPPFMYNGIPSDLRAYLGGPGVPVTEPVAIVNDGRATVLHVVGAASAAGTRHEMFTIQMKQTVPRPFCSGGPLDWVMVEGPVYFEKNVVADPYAKLEVTGRASGILTVTPVDITQDPPVVTGPSWTATVGDQHDGYVVGQTGRILAQVKRILPQEGGTEILRTQLMVASNGQNSYTRREKCLSDERMP